MSRLIDHQYEAGQRWKNDHYVIYVMAVNDDVKNEDGDAVTPGTICVTTDKPFPGKQLNATDLPPKNMDEVVAKGGYQLMDVGWHDDFLAQKKAIDDARAAAGVKEPAPITPPPQSGLGALLSK